uniref:Uncharacterized protein n=1 Tax=Glossina morsitans morsitans TaxID=37546 RepID=A0A1B0GFL4_GLOMM
MMFLIFCILSTVITLPQTISGDGVIEVFKWKQMDYYNRGNSEATTSSTFTSPSNTNNNRKGVIYFPGQYYGARSKRQQEHIINNASPSYIPYNNVPMGVTHYKGRLFITMPRRRVGIPSTLNYVDLRKDGNEMSPKLHAYPDFETNQIKANSGNLVSVYRTSVDSCGRLWFIDTGILEYPNNRMQVQKPSIWIMDLSTDRLLRRFEIPESTVEQGQGLASITIDTDKGCDKSFAYIPDLVNNQLYVYSLETSKIWTFQHNYFHFDPLAGDLNIGGQAFSWSDGIFSITIGPKDSDGSRVVLFHPMASHNEFIVSNKVLQNESHAENDDYDRDFKLLGRRGDARQSTMHEYDPHTNVVFYAEIQRNGISCWNTNKRFSSDNHGTVAQDSQLMIYPSDLTIDEDGVMWVMTNSMPIFIYSTLDTNTYNFRVWKQMTSEAIKNTVCS